MTMEVMWLITNFSFVNDIVVNAEEEEEADIRVDHLDTTTKRYKIKIGPEKANEKTYNLNGFQSKKAIGSKQ